MPHMKYTVAVRTLCEFTAKQGDLDLRFTPAPTAREGIAGHVLVASRRNAGYQAEISLVGEFQDLVVRGRADGWDPAQNQLEEIKTFRGDLARIPDNHRHLHWAQAKVYGHLLCQKLGLSELKLAVIYFDIIGKRETVISKLYDAAALRQGFEDQCRQFLDWAGQELAHRQCRDRALDSLRFPHAEFRAGQRPLAEAVYKAARGGRCLAAQAPTGIGKTIGTLFPLLKAAPAAKLDKLFFLTAKTSGRSIALQALTQIRSMDSSMPLRIIELVARDKACEHPDKACHGESCPLAQGFYDRLSRARRAALDCESLDKQTLRQVALEHQVCPYYLGHELVRWCDVVVGDFNYYFDSGGMLHGLTVANQWRVGVLVDEAHNLLERARKMYTAELERAVLVALRRSAPAVLKKALADVNRCWSELLKIQCAPYQAYDSVPAKFNAALQRAVVAIIDFQTDNPTYANSFLQRFYFDALHFLRIAELFDNHSLFDITIPCAADGGSGTQSVLCLRNIIPARFLAPRFNAAHSTTLFSATLTPSHFYSDTLGLPHINPVNEQIRQRMGAAFGGGYEYAYLYPAIRKVVQAAGRVIRTPDDRGVLYLMDDRYDRPQVRSLLPKWWRVSCLDAG